MDVKVKQLWIEALESGEYNQTKGFLKTSEGHCCLGVLCDLYAKKTGKGVWSESDGRKEGAYEMVTECGERSLCGLPSPVAEWAGLSEWEGLVAIPTALELPKPLDTALRTLAHANDKGFSFNEIADMLREFSA